MPREKLPAKVKEIADAILRENPDTSDDIAYGTAWKQYKKDNSEHKSSLYLNYLKIAQTLDEKKLFIIADKFDNLINI